MLDPKPLRLDATDEAGLLLRQAHAIAPGSPARDAADWDGLERRVRGERRASLVHLAFGAAGLAAAAAVLTFLLGPASRPSSPPWREAVAGIAGLSADEAAVLGVPEAVPGAGARSLSLSKGTLRGDGLRVEEGRWLEVATPHVRVRLASPRFTLLVTRELTALEVLEGRGQLLARAGGSLWVSAGERADSDDPRLSATAGLDAVPGAAPAVAPPPAPGAPAASLDPSGPAAPAPAPVPGAAVQPGAAPEKASPRVVADCAREAGLGPRRACFLEFASGRGLSAQNALYALGQLEREAGNGAKAVEYWSMYQRRFPEGALAPEVSVDLIHQYLALSRTHEAVAAADEFLARYPSGPRSAEVSLAKANLLCTRLGAFDQAVDAYKAALLTDHEAVRAEALFSLASCEASHGSRARAQDHWRRYLREFPSGARVAEVEQLLAPP